VVRLAAALRRYLVDDLAVSARSRVHVDGDELVHAVAHALDAGDPDVEVVLLAFDEIAHVGRVARLVRADRRGHREQQQTDERSEKLSVNPFG
jgi:hypothetical protein